MIDIDISNLIKENEASLSNTDINIGKEIMKNGIDYDISINDFASKCFTSRTSVLRFAKKLGFSGYSELKYYVNDDSNSNSNKSYSKSEDLIELYNRLKTCKKVFIYGNGGYEKVIKSAIKMYLMEIGILAEVYSGGEEMGAFTETMLKDSGLFIVDFSDNMLSKQLMFQIGSIDCLKVVIGEVYTKATNVDYNIYFPDEHDGIRLLSPYIIEFEEILKIYKKAREDDINWFNKWEL